jgi:hypothetical protein
VNVRAVYFVCVCVNVRAVYCVCVCVKVRAVNFLCECTCCMLSVCEGTCSVESV